MLFQSLRQHTVLCFFGYTSLFLLRCVFITIARLFHLQKNTPMTLFIQNIKEVVFFEKDLFRTTNAIDIRIENGMIADITPTGTTSAPAHATILDGASYVALPGLIDSHTHTIFGGSREDEFEMKLRGATYQDIAAKGGGIKSTMHRTRAASKEELLQLGIRRCQSALALGITTMEMKSGYGLSVEAEIKILETIRDVRQHTPLEICATFLGAHTIPPEYSQQREAYIRLVCETMIPMVTEQRLAEFCDAFCETNVFTPDETRHIFETAKKYGMKLKLHADQLTNTGGAELCAEMGAISADHLETISEKGLAALAGSNVVAGLLPGCSFYLRMQYPPARKMIDMGIPVALATDFNPGSCPTQNLQLIMSIACTQMRMTPDEAIKGVTLHAARALDKTHIGNIAVGMQADMVLFDVPGYRYIPYNFGQNHVAHVIKKGRVVHSASSLGENR